MRAGFMASIHNHASRLAEGTKLVCIDKFEMLKDGDKYKWLAFADIYDRHVQVANFPVLPERFDVLYVIMERRIINVGACVCAHVQSPALKNSAMLLILSYNV